MNPFIERIWRNSRWLGIFWLLNILLVAALSSGYWPWLRFYSQEPLIKSYILATQVGWMGAFIFVGLMATLLITWLPGRIVRTVARILAFSASALLLTDVLSYAQYRFHLSGFVFDLFMAGGVIELPLKNWIQIGAILAGLVGVQFIFGHVARMADESRFPWRKLGYSAWFSCLLFSQGLHAWEDANYQSAIPSLTRHFPLYYPLTAKSAFINAGLVNADEAREQAQKMGKVESGQLLYPRSPIVFKEPARKTNVLFIMIDAWRYDDETAKITPNVAHFGEHAARFHHHLSGGNSTQAGMFSLFYSLPATYWDSFRNSGVRPAMMGTFAKQGYDFEILGSAPLNHPPFDRTIFSGIEGLRLFTPGDSSVERDRRITDDMVSFLKKQDGTTPFMGMLFYDAAHGKELPSGKEKKFTPSWDVPDYMALNNSLDPLPYRNLYRNALFYVDEQIGEVLDTLKNTGLDKNTLVVITSDHGEEFNDNHMNFWGHGSNYSQAQIHVPMLVAGPGIEPQDINWITTHFDVVPMLMTKVLGVTTPYKDYSVGHNMFNEKGERDWTIIGSYFNYAIVGQDEIDVVYPGGAMETLTPALNKKDNKELTGIPLNNIMCEMNRFLR